MRFSTCLTLIVAALAIFLFYDAEARSHSRHHQGRLLDKSHILSAELHSGSGLHGRFLDKSHILNAESHSGSGLHRGLNNHGRGIVSEEDRTGGHKTNRRFRPLVDNQGRSVTITNKNGMKITAPESDED